MVIDKRTKRPVIYNPTKQMWYFYDTGEYSTLIKPFERTVITKIVTTR